MFSSARIQMAVFGNSIAVLSEILLRRGRSGPEPPLSSIANVFKSCYEVSLDLKWTHKSPKRGEQKAN
jgi:hypothetical protein